MSSSSEMRSAIARQLGRIGALASRHERNLGVDFTCGRRVIRRVRHERLRSARSKIHRLRKFCCGPRKRVAAQLVARAGMAAGVTYGASVTGTSATEVDSIRSLMFSAIERHGAGKSRTMALMLGKELDPIFRATLLPVLALARAMWESWIPVKVVSDGLLEAKKVHMWSQVQGPFGAVKLSLDRISS
eukprot:4221107-Pyramimonas_sp.AAC.1